MAGLRACLDEGMNGTAILFKMLGHNPDTRPLRWSLVMSVSPYAPYVFCDESGKWQDRDFICLCGYLSTEDNWNRFQKDWQVLCSRFNLNGLHLCSYYDEASAKGWTAPHATEVLQEFGKVIRDNILVGFAIGLDAKYYRSLPRDQREAFDPPTACLQRLLRLIRNRLDRERYQGRISITLDEEEGAVISLYKSILRLRRCDPVLGRYIGAVSFADD